QGAHERISLAGQQDEVAGDGDLAATAGLEVDGDGRAHGRGHDHAVFGDLLRPRNTELVDARAGLSLVAEDLVEPGAIKAEVGRCRRGGRRSKRCLAESKGGVDGGCELDRLTLAAGVHVERGGSSAQEGGGGGRHLDGGTT